MAALSALRTWSAETPRAASAARSRSTRTAGVAPPAMSTSATPGSWRMRWAMSESARLYSSDSGRVGEVSARIRIGALFGLALRYTGAVRRPAGRSGAAALIAACTSRAASSTWRPGAKIIHTVALPSLLYEFIVSRPPIWPRWRSSGAATVEAMVRASAPGWPACTKMAGNSTLGRAATGSRK